MWRKGDLKASILDAEFRIEISRLRLLGDEEGTVSLIPGVM
jgi:hypothetical protein